MNNTVPIKPYSDREDFLRTLFKLYKNSFTEGNQSTWLDAYKQVLPIGADYEKLYNRLISEYSGQSAPKPAWFVGKFEMKKEPPPENEKDKVWIGTIVATKHNRRYEFGYGGVAPDLETSKRWLAKEGLTILEIR